MSHLTMEYVCHPILPGHMLCPKHKKIGTTVQNDCIVFMYNVVLHDKKHSDEIIMRRNIILC